MRPGLLLQQKVIPPNFNFAIQTFFSLGAACLSAQDLPRMEKRTSVSLTPSLRTRCSLRYLSINPKVFSNYFILPSKVFDTLVQEGSWNYHKLNISQSEGERKCRQKRETCGSPNSNRIIVDGLRLKKMRGSDVSKDKEKNEDICQYFTSL